MPQIIEYVQRTRAATNLPGGSTSNLTRAIGDELARFGELREQQKEQDAAVWATKALSDAQIEWTEQMLNRQESAEPGADGFTDSVLEDFDTYAEQTAQAAPTRASRDYMQARLSAFRTRLAEQSLGFEAKARVANTVSTVESSIEGARKQANMDPSRYGELVAERMATIDELRLDAETKQALKEKAQTQIARDAVLGMIDTDAATALEALNSEDHGILAVDALTADDRLVLQERAERRVFQNAQEAEAERVKDIAKVASDLELTVYRGQGSRAEIDKALEAEVITPAKRTQLQLEMDRQLADQVSSNAMRDLVRMSRGLRIPLDPGDTDHRKAVDLAYTDIEEDPFTPEHSLEAGRLIQDTGIVPRQVRSMVRAMAVSGDVEQSVAVADLVDHIQTVAPAALSQFSEDEKSFALLTQELIRAGADPAVAVDMARTRTFKTSESERAIVLERYRKESKGNENELDDFIDDDFDRINIIQPEAPDLMKAEFNRLTESYFLKTQDIGPARKLAWNDLKAVWGLSDINGKPRLMKYPPEARGEFERDELPDDGLVISDARTGRDGTYSVVVVGKDGLPRIQPFRWEPTIIQPEDYTASVAASRKARQVLQAIEFERDHAQEVAAERLSERRERGRALIEASQ